ncbi:NADP oxidoreductase [Pseudoalteromonas citrea]|uniref:NADP oxidoreductase n=1 Tax=Pseudoalteromonas citrea TaxID=43655 RepID=A0A5S3XME6_9GAMM|nr:NADPH-dependent F420 reductase [Pseudoalteromonas citrea]TMP39170.1 NADP oxidoreductase [Pseudoalteromonas citrea]TMP57165.1 NADP oxidoreductase [Pseudoalteromonas citrea]
MRIGIIGAGAMAQTLAQHALKAGHEVMLSNSRAPESLSAIVEAFKCYSGTAEQAAEYGDVVIIAVPLYAYNRLPKEQLKGKIVLDLLNYFPHRDGRVAPLHDSDITTSELLASYLTGSRVVKAFNSITVQDLASDARSIGASDRRAIPIASNDEEAKTTVAKLINEFGFDAANGGNLADSWRFERFRPAYCVAANKQTLEKILATTNRDTVVSDGHWIHNRYV